MALAAESDRHADQVRLVIRADHIVAGDVEGPHQGRVHEVGRPEEVFANPQTAELKQFLGVS